MNVKRSAADTKHLSKDSFINDVLIVYSLTGTAVSALPAESCMASSADFCSGLC